jgi:hypothetical protein
MTYSCPGPGTRRHQETVGLGGVPRVAGKDEGNLSHAWAWL